MGHVSRFLILFAKFFMIFCDVNGETFSVRIGTEEPVNVVDSRFLSFTVDPKYLFSNVEKYNSNESICMATALTPAFIRIAGPSTAKMVFNNSTITFTDLDTFEKNDSIPGKHKKDEIQQLSITYSQWKKFVEWTKKTDFDLVFALSNEEKTDSGLWDPSSALDILTVADKAGVSDIFWQLGYECRNQSMDDYLNDLETLRVITETVSADETRGWRAVGGDVSGCLRADSKSDFGDYVTLTDEMMDAVLLNGKSSARELERLSEDERLKLLKRLSTSSTPLWLTETAPRLPHHIHFELHRAADWMTSLGFSARNGFAVNFRELIEDELFEPTMSFYMALLYKNLVGERVLEVQMDSEGTEAEMFAHCTTLRHKPVPGAVTLYGVNMGTTPARLSVKLSKREEGGDILQFILALDLNGNIAVNGRAMYHEGDIRPVVKRVRPYKSLLLSLPPKSIGFWVLANTNIKACQDASDNDTTELIEAEDVPEVNVTEVNKVKKRSMEYGINEVSAEISHGEDVKVSTGLKKRLHDLNSDIDNVHLMFEKKRKENKEIKQRTKRGINSEETETIKRKHRRHNGRSKNDSDSKPKLGWLKNTFSLNSRVVNSRPSRACKVCKNFRNLKNRLSSRHSKQTKIKTLENKSKEINNHKNLRRRRRSITEEKSDVQKIKDNISSENEVDFDEKDQIKLWKILRNIHQELKDLPGDSTDDDTDNTEYVDNVDSKDVDQIVVKTKRTKGRTTVNYSENSKKGLLKNTVSSVINVLSDLNNNLNKFWNAISLLD